MRTLIDFHSHVLPGMDDGSASVEESIGMLKLAASQGIKRIVATPHFYANYDDPKHFLARRAEKEAELRKAMAEYDDLPELIVGAEVYYFSGISESDILKELTIGKYRCILIEMPQPPWTTKMYKELESIALKQGLIPIIAHIDRYISPLRTYGIPKKLESLPVYVQANAGFINRSSTKRMAMRMLKKLQIHLLGSDCHNLTNRAPNMGVAIESIKECLGLQALRRINDFEEEVLV